MATKKRVIYDDYSKSVGRKGGCVCVRGCVGVGRRLRGRGSTVGENACEGALRWGGAFGERGATVGEDACEGALRWGGAFGERGQQQGEDACEGALR